MSRGLGAARNPVLSPRRNVVLFESSSDPVTGADNGVAQIWFGDLNGEALGPITAGLADSTNPILSADGRLVLRMGFVLSAKPAVIGPSASPFRSPNPVSYTHLRAHET